MTVLSLRGTSETGEGTAETIVQVASTAVTRLVKETMVMMFDITNTLDWCKDCNRNKTQRLWKCQRRKWNETRLTDDVIFGSDLRVCGSIDD